MTRLSHFLWLCVWLGLAFYLALTLWLGLTGIAYPYQLDYGEGDVHWFALQIFHGQAIYKALTVFPFMSSNYPPVAMLLSAALMPIFGEGFTGGRLLNFAAMLITTALIYRVVRVESKDRWAAALAALFFIGSPYIYHWASVERVDLIGLAFAFGGVYCVWKFVQPSRADSGRWLLLMLGGLFFFLALYTKHTLWAAPAAAFFALWQRNRRQAIALAGAVGAIGGATFLVVDYATAGGFYLGLIESNASTFLTDQLVEQLSAFASTFPILVLLALWGWIQRIRAKGAFGAKQIGVLEWYGITAVPMLALAGRIGAWENYFFETLAIACVFVGIQISDFRRQASGVRHQTSDFRFQISQFAIRNSQLVLSAFLLFQIGLMWREHDPRIAANLMAENIPANQQLGQLLQRTSGVVISEDMGVLAQNGKPVDYYSFQYSMLARSGRWDQSWELNGLRDGLFPLVILERGTREDVDHYRRFTREFVSALDRYYAHTQTFGKYEIYTPAPPLKLQAADFGDAIALVGWNLQPATLQPGIGDLTLVWQAKRALSQRYKAFVYLEKSGGDKVTQDDHEPRGGLYPTSRWAANEMVRETFTLNIPVDLVPGSYVLKTGWYDADSGDRLEVPASADNTVVLATYQVK